MKHTRLTIAIVLALLGTVAAHALDIDAALTPEVKAKLEKGEAVVLKNKVDDKGGKVISNSAAMIIVNKPLAEVWPHIADYSKLPEFIPRLISSEKYSEVDGKIGIKQCFKVLWRKVNYHVLQTEDTANFILSFDLDKSQKNDIAETSGRWELRAYGDGKCLAVYTLALDTGMPVPRFIQNMLVNDDLPGTMHAVKKRAESGGTFKKD